MKIMVAAFLLAAPIAASAAGHQDETLLQAVGFALTGSDNVPKVVDRQACVFAVGSAVFHLNNVEVDRIIFQNTVKNSPGYGEVRLVTVELHGDDTVYEADVPEKYDHSDAPGLPAEIVAKLKEDKAEHPEQYIPHHTSSNEYKTTLVTNESDRVQRAWTYIYTHGCTGTKSSF
ncbi:hypothetical protein QZM18_03340 [Burkholderia diffusa]|nr:hypothetical protein [Burkholderia diffusa]